VIFLDNNKGLIKTDEKSNAELRKIHFKNGGNIGIENGEKLGNTEEKFTKRSKLSHNK
jgi:hypothetical protein